MANVSNISITRSVDNNDASGRVVFKDDIVITPDQIVEASVGFDPTENLKLVGQITKADRSGSAADFKADIEVSALSLFKNFMKHRISTDWLEGMTGQAILNLLVSDFMSWTKYDFTACAGTTFARLRVDDMLLPEAIRKIAEACLCEIYFEGDGTIKAVAFPGDEVDHEYTLDDVESASVGSGLDIGVINTINLTGRQYDPEEDDVPVTEAGEESFTWAGLNPQRTYSEELGAYTEVAFAKIELYQSPILRPIFEITGETLSNTATYRLYGFSDTDVTIQIIRNPEDELSFPEIGWPDYSFTITVSGYLYQDRGKNRVTATVENSQILEKYNGIRMERDYDNPFAQDETALEDIGNFHIKKAYYESFAFRGALKHNPTLEPNDIILVPQVKEDRIYVYCVIVRSIEISWEADGYKLIDNVSGWYKYIEEWIIL